jgi:hypothetical protein
MGDTTGSNDVVAEETPLEGFLKIVSEEDTDIEEETEEGLDLEENEDSEEDEDSEDGDDAEEDEEESEEDDDVEEESDESEEEEPPPSEKLLFKQHMDKLVKLPDGSKVSVRELRQGYMKHSDYKESISQIEQKEQQIREAAETFTPLVQFAEQLKANPNLVQAMDFALGGKLEEAAEAILQSGQQRVIFDPRYDQLNQRITQRDQKEQEQMIVLNLQREMDALVAKHPELRGENNPNVDLVIQEAERVQIRSGNIPRLEDCYKIVFFDKVATRAKKEGHKKAVRDLKKGAPTSMKSGKPATGKEKKSDGKSKDPVSEAVEYYKTL